jgi:phosphotransferase system enzyme I (PtsI)
MEISGDTATYRGLAISSGCAMGRAHVYRDILLREHEHYEISEDGIEEEWARIEQAVEKAREDLVRISREIQTRVDDDASNIFLVQDAMLQDPKLVEDLKATLREELVNAEYVVKQVLLRWEKKFRRLDSEELKQRGDDIADLGRRLLLILEGIHAHMLEAIPQDSVLVARRLLPSDTVFLSRRSTAAVVVEFGGRVSHAAILTRELGVPGVAQVPELLDRVRTGDTVFVDGDHGMIIVGPEEDLERELHARIERWRSRACRDKARCREPAITSEGRRIEVMANAGCAEDVASAMKNGADGIGLYRTEHIYLAAQSPPSEKQIAETLRASLSPVGDRPVTLRLLDAGGDKNIPFLNVAPEENPFLGRRGIRLLFDYPDLLEAQIRAFAAISEQYDIRIMIPMVTVAEDMAAVRELMRSAAGDMGIAVPPPLGAMIETPAAALCAADIIEQADFLSIGSNDLTQYTMVAGRENPAVSEYFIEDHPAVMRLVQMVVREAGDTPVGICGELAGYADAQKVLVGLGLTQVSVAPSLVPRVKQSVRRL